MVLGIELDEDKYVALMTKLIGEAKFVQNMPPKFVPQEDKVIAHLLDVLRPHSVENGGVLKIEHVTFVEGRGNLVVEYKPEGATGSVAFVGSHLDVVPANPEGWDVDPFKLSRDGDKLYGRGTTDCLGHVGLITLVLEQLAIKKPALKTAVTVIFIASEENNSIPGVGVDMLMEKGYLDGIKKGPVYWVDASDSEPCVATAGVLQWKLRADGKLFHSGLPHKGINSLEMAMDAVKNIQDRFYKDFPSTKQEEDYFFATPSTMKPTQIRISEGSVNQIPPWVEVLGDVRLTPFYDVQKCQAAINGYVDDLNANIAKLADHGPASKYVITEEDGKERKGKLTLTWEGEPFKGIACDLKSPGHKALLEATREVKGKVTPFSIGGSLPLVGDMKESGFDLQIVGFGKSAVYHGDNEYCLISDMKDAAKILSAIIDRIDAAL